MSVDKIGSGPSPVAPSGGGNKKAKESKERLVDLKDRVELSEEAKQRLATDELAKLKAINSRIESGFYNSKEVAEKVVEGLLRQLRGKSGDDK
ncbi:MAG: hypothetical protein HY961_16155 [Ignavibacteriae bacterium]|nr:hypothetical protein [Ignavibacteriota bacterium]